MKEARENFKLEKYLRKNHRNWFNFGGFKFIDYNPI
jgi:predicted LPLAT superfamily acyltransferase